MATTINMGLTKWPSGSDPFAHTALATDMDLIDAHDHTSTKGVPIPTAGLANLAVTTGKLADASATKVKLGADVDYESAFSTWKTVRTDLVDFTGGWTGTLRNTTAVQTPFYLNPSDFTAGARTTVFRLRLVMFFNATSTGPLTSVTAGLHELLSTAGGSNVVTYTNDATAIASSGVSVTPATSTRFHAEGGSFTPLASWYSLGIKGNATAAANSAGSGRIDLQVRQT